MGKYTGDIVSADVYTIHSPVGSGVVQAVQLRYEMDTVRIIGLNTEQVHLILTRPNGRLTASHFLVAGSDKLPALLPTPIGAVEVARVGSTGGSSNIISIQTAAAAALEGRLTTEAFVFLDAVVFVFFEYT